MMKNNEPTNQSQRSIDRPTNPKKSNLNPRQRQRWEEEKKPTAFVVCIEFWRIRTTTTTHQMNRTHECVQQSSIGICAAVVVAASMTVHFFFVLICFSDQHSVVCGVCVRWSVKHISTSEKYQTQQNRDWKKKPPNDKYEYVYIYILTDRCQCVQTSHENIYNSNEPLWAVYARERDH